MANMRNNEEIGGCVKPLCSLIDAIPSFKNLSAGLDVHLGEILIGEMLMSTGTIEIFTSAATAMNFVLNMIPEDQKSNLIFLSIMSDPKVIDEYISRFVFYSEATDTFVVMVSLLKEDIQSLVNTNTARRADNY